MITKAKVRILIEKQIKPLEAKVMEIKAAGDIQRDKYLAQLEVLYIVLQDVDSLPDRENPADIKTNY